MKTWTVTSRIPSHWTNQQGQIWLNVGSGAYVEDGYVNLDNHVFMPLRKAYPWLAPLLPRNRAQAVEQLYKADRRAVLVRWDCRKPLELPANSVDYILCSHFIEHVYPDRAAEILRGFFRVMKPGAALHMIVPDLQLFIDSYLSNRGLAVAAPRFLTGTLLSQPLAPSMRYRVLQMLGFDGLQHRWMYDRASLTQLLLDSGFRIMDESTPSQLPSLHVRKDDPESLHAFAIKPG